MKIRVLFAFLATILSAMSGLAEGLLDDRAITITKPSQVDAKREQLIGFLWGSAGFPAYTMPSQVAKSVKSPVAALENLKRVDEIHIDMESHQQSLAFHFIAERSNQRLVVVHQGHACTFDDSPGPADTGYGMQRTINGLLSDGYSVLAVYMPHYKPDDCGAISHESVFNLGAAGSPMKFFLEPVAVCLNYLKTKAASDGFPSYQDYSMIGLSGGGWTTIIYAAIDPTIRFSFPVAGSVPLYLRFGGSIGDAEQNMPEFYRIAGYPDLYILGSYGPDREQIQILNRRDNCCFGEAQHNATQTGMNWEQAVRTYEFDVRNALANLGSGGYFHVQIDEVATEHQISHNTINTILAELSNGRRN